MPVLFMTPWISRCPEPALLDAGLGIECDVARDDGGTAAVAVSWRPSVFDLATCPDDPGAVNLPVLVLVSPTFGVASGPAMLACSLTSRGRAVVVATLPLALQETHSPLAADAIAFAPGRMDVMTSSVFGSADPGVARASLRSCGVAPTTPDARFGACALDAAQTVWGNATPPAVLATKTPLAAPPPFSLNVTSTTLLVLRAGLDRAFSSDTSATVAGQPCVLAAVSGDGRWAAIYTPNATTMCGPAGTAAGRCGYDTLVVTTPGASDGGAPRGATLACPPFCAGDLVRTRVGYAGGAAVVPCERGAGGNGGEHAWVNHPPPRSPLPSTLPSQSQRTRPVQLLPPRCLPPLLSLAT